MRPDTVLGYALLGMLHQQPYSGYDLRKLFTLTPLSQFSDSPGAIYPALERLRAKGWIGASRPVGGRRRREYRPTSAGRRAWTAWLHRPATRAEVVWGLDALMIRFAFMGGTVGQAETMRFLDGLARELDAHVLDLKRYREGAAGGLTTTGGLALDAGIESYEARAAWARRARTVLTQKGGES
jgi:DNA-binding PadR family transcriptional regulator